jgi:hypothetical protein
MCKESYIAQADLELELLLPDLLSAAREVYYRPRITGRAPEAGSMACATPGSVCIEGAEDRAEAPAMPLLLFAG